MKFVGNKLSKLAHSAGTLTEHPITNPVFDLVQKIGCTMFSWQCEQCLLYIRSTVSLKLGEQREQYATWHVPVFRVPFVKDWGGAMVLVWGRISTLALPGSGEITACPVIELLGDRGWVALAKFQPNELWSACTSHHAQDIPDDVTTTRTNNNDTNCTIRTTRKKRTTSLHADVFQCQLMIVTVRAPAFGFGFLISTTFAFICYHHLDAHSVS